MHGNISRVRSVAHLFKPRLHWNKVWQCWQVSNPLALSRAACTIAAHAAHQLNVANDRSNRA